MTGVAWPFAQCFLLALQAEEEARLRNPPARQQLQMAFENRCRAQRQVIEAQVAVERERERDGRRGGARRGMGHGQHRHGDDEDQEEVDNPRVEGQGGAEAALLSQFLSEKVMGAFSHFGMPAACRLRAFPPPLRER